MSRVKLFTENFLVYGLGGIISKIIPLLMVPIVTRIMPTTDYFGISDLSNTLIQFGTSLAIMGMYDAMYRMFFEKDELEYKEKVCSTALAFTIFTSVVVFLLMVVFRTRIAAFFFSDRNYANIVYLSAIATLVGATNGIISAPTRMQNKRRVFLITNTAGPLLSYSISIPMLLSGHYLIALPLAAVISGAVMEFAFYVMNHKWFDFKKFDILLLKQMLPIALPLLPNFLIYWVFNSCDRLMITNIIGIGAAGIYAVGSKLGNASQLIYVAFAGGWQFFAFSTMNEDNQVKTNSLIFEYLGIISYAATAFICAFSFVIFKILFTEEYLGAYIVAPYLFLAPLLQMLFQVAANQFLVIKKTWPNMFILLSGAIANIAINYFLIPVLGIEGASIATMTGYILADVICVVVLIRMGLMVISKKFVISTLIASLFMISWRLWLSDITVVSILAAMVLVASMSLIYKEDIYRLVKGIKSR